MKKRLKKLLTIVMSAMMLVVFMPTSVFAEGDAGTTEPTVNGPVVSKTITDNGDGTHTISLSVTGQTNTTTESTKANVVIVFDLSNSMNNDDSYIKDDKGGYGYDSSEKEYVVLYKKDGSSYTAIKSSEGYEGDVYIRVYSNYYKKYSGTRYTNRLEVARSATASLITSLAANNKSADDDTVEISFMSFATRAHTSATYHNQWYKGNDMSGLVSEVMNVSKPSRDSGGTNWDDALKKAQTVAAGKAAQNEDTYIIFVSDGNPTYYNSSNGDLGGSGSDSSTQTVNAALNEADKIKTAGYKFYGVGFMGAGDYMPDLCKRANGTSEGYYYSAENQTALEQAFDEIVNSISNSAGYKNVVVTDNVTSLTATNLKLVDGGAKGFTYTRSDDVEYTGLKATYADNTVTWDLGGEPLVSGVTYTVSFKVWPSQEAYDLIADLNNGTASYEKLDNDIKSQIKVESTEEGNSYSLKTNTADGNQVSYTRVDTKEVKNKPAGTENADGSIAGSDGYKYVQTDGKWVGTKETKGTTALTNPAPIPVVSYNMEVEKKWKGGAGSAVTLELLKDGEPTGVTVELNKDNNWRGSVFLAPGLVVGEKPKEILDDGHNYSLRETSGGTEYYSFSSNTQHPMLVNSATNVVKNLTNPDDISLDDIGTLVGTNTLIPPSAVSKELKILKKVTGKDAIENFAFELNLDGESGDTEGVTDAEGNAITTLTAQSSSTTKIAAGGQEYVSFGNVKFSKEGTYVFKVRETTTTTAGGWTYDSTTKEIKVKVEKASDKNELVIASISATPEFTNSYSAKAATISIPVKKSLTGTGANTFDISNAFTFTLTGEDDDTPMPETTTITNPDSNGGTASFGDITYTEAGTYEYKVTESGSVDGIVNDANSEKTVTVTVVDNGSGQLVASIAPGNDITEDGALKFTNKVIEPKDVQLQVTKKVKGKDATVPFTFSIKLAEGNSAGVVMPQNNEVTTTDSIKAGAQETVSFDSIRFTKAGTYTFDVKEVYTDTDVPAGWTYDSATKQIEVNVAKASDKDELTVTSISDTPVFTNSYSAKAATISIPVTKELTGEGASSFNIREAFTFTLTADNGTPMPKTTEIKNPNANGGTAEFGPITYTAAGTYNYTVTESGSVDGIENDPVSSKSVTVEVTDNNEGQLVANITQGANLTFTNKVIEPVEVVLHATKKVEGRDAAEAFTFSIRQTKTNAEGADGVVMPETVTATTPANIKKDQSATVDFNSIKFTKAGTYTFNVKETNETAPAGWSYDKTEQTITVVVSKTNGVLSTTVQNDNPTFTNKYSASPVNNFSIPVTKQLEGTGAPDITGKYTFTLTGKNGAPMPADTQKTNPTDGRIEFGPITYNSAGEYEYTVSETGTVAHITNDSNATKNITVVVEDNGKGQLVASFKEGNGVTFTNTYAPEPTKANISVEKILEGTGAPGIKDKYTFTLAAKANAPMPNNSTELKNPDSDGGTVTFGDITYTEAGTYKYTVTESGDVPGITNDSNATKEVVVVVTDNKGQLEAVVNSGDTLTFTNTYAPTATSATLEVEKVLKNMELQENQFTFQLLDSEDNLIDTKQNAADGTVKFDTIDYTVPGEYNYTIKEVIPEDAKKAKGVTYDKHEVAVKVTVADNTQGVLEATVEFTGNTTFTNTYNASGKSGIVGLKTLEGKTLEAGQFTFKIEGKDGAPMPEKTEAKNDANGYVNFGEIDFELADLGIAEEDKSDENGSDGATEGESTEQGGTSEEGGSSEPAAAVATSTDEGANDEPSDENKNEDAAVPRTKTFTYTVTEVAGNEPGITYNTTPQEFTITVTDDGQGGLTVTTNPPTDKPNAPLFTIKNTYTPAKANIGVTKNFVDGRTGLSAWDEYEDAKFEFELKAEDNAPLKPAASGSAASTIEVTKTSQYASFGMYEFDEAGTYEYTITEKNTGSEDVEYDTTSHKVTVEVKEDSTTHQLSAEVKYDNNEESLVVTNTLKPAENAKLNVVKHVVNTNGQPLSVDGVFHVALFSDKNLTHRVSAVNELVFDGSKPTAEAEFKVTAGKKYYVAETDADGKLLSGAQLFGEGEDAASYSICFGDPADYDNVIDYPQSAAAEIPESGSADDVEFSNIFDGAKFMVLGSISIDKEVKIGKETKNVDGSFYVTAEYSQENSDELEKRTVELKVKNGKTEQPVTISNLPTNTDITLKETDANGNILENSVYNPIFTYGDESGKTLKVKLTEDDSDINVKLENSEKLIDVAFDLTWDDYGNRDNTRDEYEVTLFANGVEVEDSTKVFSPDVTEGDDCKWTDLRQYDDEENEIVYSVKQTKVPDQYSSNTDGTDVGLSPDEDGIVHLIDTYRAVKITKKVTDSTGKAIKYNGDFYVTMFADPDCKEIVKDPVKITLDNEKSKTVIIPVPANSLYYLAETDADGNKVDSSFEFIPTFSSTVAEASDDETSIVLTNQAKAGTSADDPDNDTDAKTGDSANLMLMLLALLTSMLIGAVVLIRGRRREN